MKRKEEFIGADLDSAIELELIQPYEFSERENICDEKTGENIWLYETVRPGRGHT